MPSAQADLCARPIPGYHRPAIINDHAPRAIVRSDKWQPVRMAKYPRTLRETLLYALKLVVHDLKLRIPRRTTPNPKLDLFPFPKIALFPPVLRPPNEHDGQASADE